MTAVQAARRVRAYLDFPKTKLSYGSESVIVTKAHVVSGESDAKDFIIQCKDNSLLAIDELIGPSGKRMSGRAFKNGYASQKDS
ncbi:methionyl-tRNA formyltransferase, partial [Candidatus Saccharibacteria bacterium]|nr:methionyl-tRNA formyltransferase [Candidatus Saccharibacteria bacterium]